MSQDSSEFIHLESQDDLHRCQGSPACSRSSIHSKTTIEEISYTHFLEEPSNIKEHKSFIGEFLASGIEAVTHLNEDHLVSRIIWRMIILTSIVFVTVLVTMQINKYIDNPVSTNYEIEYPSKIPFPAIAICNNNFYRLSYLETLRTSNRSAPKTDPFRAIDPENHQPFDEVIEKFWDMDAVQFIHDSTHEKSRMILGCWWPNNTRCKMSDFRKIWTVDGMCYAINTNENNTLDGTGTGSTNALTLLLNVEKYDHVELCTEHFRTKRQTGFKLMLYNQTDKAMLSANSVNIPPGHTVDVPFWMVHRSRLPGRGCSNEPFPDVYNRNRFDVSCGAHHSYIQNISSYCGCSMHGLFAEDAPHKNERRCNVDDYFACVVKKSKRIYEEQKFKNWEPPCDTTEYTAWQDMLGLPKKIIPWNFNDNRTDENGWDQIHYREDGNKEHFSSEQQYQCDHSSYLTKASAEKIRKQAISSLEIFYQFKDEYLSPKFTKELKFGLKRLEESGWGFDSSNFRNVFERLKEVSCFRNIIDNHSHIITTFLMDQHTYKNSLVYLTRMLLGETTEDQKENRSLEELRVKYGPKAVFARYEEVRQTLWAMDLLSQLFHENSYFQISFEKELSATKMLFELIGKLEAKNITKRQFLSDLEPYYLDLNDFLFRHRADGIILNLNAFTNNQNIVTQWWNKTDINGGKETVAAIIAEIFREENKPTNQENVWNIVNSMLMCAKNEMEEKITKISDEFKKLSGDAHDSYVKVFVEKDSMKPVAMDEKFANENFALVNIFLHRMSVEKWTQNEDYSFWSLASDIGGALDLFLGASLLTMVEIAYLFMKHGLCGLGRRRYKKWLRQKQRDGSESSVMCDNCRNSSVLIEDNDANSERNNEDFHDAVEFHPRIDCYTLHNRVDTISSIDTSFYGSEPSQIYLTPVSIKKQLTQK